MPRSPRPPVVPRSVARPLWVALAGVTLIAAGAVRSAPPTLLYNPSDSAPRGWYLRSPDRPTRVGQYALAALPERAAQLAAERAYLPLHTRLIKRVAALGGDYVCATSDGIRVNRRNLGVPLAEDSHRRSLTAWQGCRVLAPGEFFLMSSTHPASFDSRYFGPLDAAHIEGRAVPLWTWP